MKTEALEQATVAVLDHAAFLERREAWHELVASAGGSPFITHAWLRAWWRHFGEGLDDWGIIAFKLRDVVRS